MSGLRERATMDPQMRAFLDATTGADGALELKRILA